MNGDGGENRAALTLLRVLVAAAVLGAAFAVMRPFLLAVIWAAIFAYVTWPLFDRARRASGRPAATALVFTLVLLLVFGVPTLWLLITLAQQSFHLLDATRGWIEAGAPLPQALVDLRWIGPRIEEFRAQVFEGDGASELAGVAQRLSRSVLVVVGSVAGNVFSFLITLLALFAFYSDGEKIVERTRRFAKAVFPAASDRFLDDIGAVVRATVFGLLGTAIVQGAVAALGFLIFGVPYFLALGGLVAVLSFIPAGPVLVWGAATLWLAANDQNAMAVGNALWGLFIVSSIDNVLRPILIRRSGSVEIPFLLIFFGVLGGLAAFGLLGLFIGPVILSVTFALLAQVSTPEPAAAGE